MVKRAVPAAILVLTVFAFGMSRADVAPLMTKEQLLTILGKPDVVVIDVRNTYDWEKSHAKIKGAVHENGMKFGSWKDNYPKDKTLVLYCA
jgi:rhodanese-related sulfurtransferase